MYAIEHPVTYDLVPGLRVRIDEVFRDVSISDVVLLVLSGTSNVCAVIDAAFKGGFQRGYSRLMLLLVCIIYGREGEREREREREREGERSWEYCMQHHLYPDNQTTFIAW